jgi:hypothetical protein
MFISAEAQPIYNSTNNHYYEIMITDEPISWSDAKEDAELQFFNGISGHLATITTHDELNFILNTFFSSQSEMPPEMWIGGFRSGDNSDDSEGWQWVTGEPFNITNWPPSASDEPVDRTVLAMLSDGTWSDLSLLSSQLSAYLIEYNTTLPLPDPIFIPLINCDEDLRVQGHYKYKVLDLTFELNVTRPVEWNAWLIQGNETVSLFSMNVLSSLNQPIEIPISLSSFLPQGVVGALTTINSPKQGIICSQFITVNTAIPFIAIQSGPLMSDE